MKTRTFTYRSRIAAPAYAVFRWHARPDALVKLTPPGERLRILRHEGICNGARAVLLVGRWPFRVRWIAEHRDYIEGRQFKDVQVQGPFALFEHTHSVTPDGPDACWLEDRIEYALPFGELGRLLGDWLVRRKLRGLFEYRHRVTADQVTAIGGDDAA